MRSILLPEGVAIVGELHARANMLAENAYWRKICGGLATTWQLDDAEEGPRPLAAVACECEFVNKLAMPSQR